MLGLDLGGHRSELVRVVADEAERDGATDAVSGASDDSLGAIAAAQGLAWACRAKQVGFRASDGVDG